MKTKRNKEIRKHLRITADEINELQEFFPGIHFSKLVRRGLEKLIAEEKARQTAA